MYSLPRLFTIPLLIWVRRPIMRIIEEVKLDFNDVLIKPKRSTLISPKMPGWPGNSNSDIQIEIGKVFL